MKAIATLLKSVLFLGVCIISSTLLPVLFIVGALALFVYALVVESFHPPISRQRREPDERAAQEVADGLCGTAPQRPISP